MHIKRRGTRAMLYRSSWVPKGSAGNTHGYSIQTFVGSLGLDAQCLPHELKNKFSSDELQYLESKVFQPARIESEQKKQEVERRESDPIWRLDEAERLCAEAAVRSERGAVSNVKVSAIHASLGRVRTITPVLVPPSTVANPVSSTTEPGRADPLRDALIAIKAARDAVFAGRYGSAPAEGVRATYAYRTWAEIFEAIEGPGNGSLLRALQSKGFAKTRGK